MGSLLVTNAILNVFTAVALWCGTGKAETVNACRDQVLACMKTIPDDGGEESMKAMSDCFRKNRLK